MTGPAAGDDTFSLPVDSRVPVIMSEHTVAIAVATYRSKADANQDFGVVRACMGRPDLHHLALAQVGKGDDGQLAMDRHASRDSDEAWCRVLMGAALATVAAPLGIRFLTPRVATPADWAGIAALVAVFWYDVPKDRLHKMSELLEAHQAALFVVAVDAAGLGVSPLLLDRSISTLVVTASADLATRHAQAIDELHRSPAAKWRTDS
jgi:hypothetical protein